MINTPNEVRWKFFSLGANFKQHTRCGRVVARSQTHKHRHSHIREWEMFIYFQLFSFNLCHIFFLYTQTVHMMHTVHVHDGHCELCIYIYIYGDGVTNMAGHHAPQMEWIQFCAKRHTAHDRSTKHTHSWLIPEQIIFIFKALNAVPYKGCVMCMCQCLFAVHSLFVHWWELLCIWRKNTFKHIRQ